MSRENVELVRRATEAFSRRDLATWLAVNDADLEFVTAPGWPERDVRGAEAAWDFFLRFFDAFEPLTTDAPEVVDAGGDKVLDAKDRAKRGFRRPLLATLAFAGLRIGELLALRWNEVDLAQGKLNVRASKTDAGIRLVDIQPELREDLAIWKSQTSFGGAEDLVFPTATGKAQNRNNVGAGSCSEPQRGRTSTSPRRGQMISCPRDSHRTRSDVRLPLG